MNHDPAPSSVGHTDAEVHIIGGGLGGLAAAALVARSGRTVTVHEGRGRLGGRGTTDSKDGYRFNQGPHALYLAGDAHRVLRTLGIRPAGRAPNTTGAQMVHRGHVGLAPGGPLSLLRSSVLGWRDKIALAQVLHRIDRLDPAALGCISVAEWVDGLSPRQRVCEILHTVIRLATYVNAPEQLSADVALMQVQLALGDGVIYLDRGWEQLVDALAATDGVDIARESRVGELPDARCVIVATGGPSSVAALTGQRFEVGPSADVSVLDAGLTRPPRHDFVLGIDPPMYLSNHGFPDGMAPAGASSVSVAEYLAPDVDPDRGRLRAFLDHAGIAPETIATERYLHRMSAVSAIAMAATGGLSGRPGGVVADRHGVFVVGDWVGPRGHLLDAVLASAEDAAHAAINHLDRQASVR